MRKTIYYLLFVSLLGTLSSCQDEHLQSVSADLSEKATSRALYDNGYVEWDNTYYLDYRCGSTDIVHNSLPVPWASGSSQSIGIPTDWLDNNITNSNPKMRKYSHANGWELVYSNLLESGLRNKYFALYNKYSGLMRFFFYAMESSSGYGTSTTFAGVQVTGSSILNFTESNPKAIDVMRTSTTYVYAPNCDFAQAICNPIDTTAYYALSGSPYKDNNWYGMEFECSYDPSLAIGSTLAVKLWAANIMISKTEGNQLGDVLGNISTTYTNVPSFDISLSFNNSKSQTTTVKQSTDASGNTTASNVDSEVKKGSGFFSSLWNSFKSSVPSLVNKGAGEGIKSLFTGGASILTNSAGKLLSSAFGIGSSTPMSSLYNPQNEMLC